MTMGKEEDGSVAATSLALEVSTGFGEEGEARD